MAAVSLSLHIARLDLRLRGSIIRQLLKGKFVASYLQNVQFTSVAGLTRMNILISNVPPYHQMM